MNLDLLEHGRKTITFWFRTDGKEISVSYELRSVPSPWALGSLPFNPTYGLPFPFYGIRHPDKSGQARPRGAFRLVGMLPDRSEQAGTARDSKQYAYYFRITIFRVAE